VKLEDQCPRVHPESLRRESSGIEDVGAHYLRSTFDRGRVILVTKYSLGPMNLDLAINEGSMQYTVQFSRKPVLRRYDSLLVYLYHKLATMTLGCTMSTL